MCLISWERTQRRDPHKLLGDSWCQKGVPNAAFSATKSLVYCFSLPLIKKSAPNMTRRRFHRIMEMIPARPWQSNSPFVSTPTKQSTGMQGVQARCGAELSPFLSIVQCPGRPVILGMEKEALKIGPRIGPAEKIGKQTPRKANVGTNLWSYFFSDFGLDARNMFYQVGRFLT